MGCRARRIILVAARCVQSSALTVRGDCQVDGECVTSPNFPNAYDASESCGIFVAEGNTEALTVEAFQTEASFDTLTVNNQPYSGNSGPDGVVPTGSISWSSDFGVSGSGWRLCLSGIQSCGVRSSVCPFAEDGVCDYQSGFCEVGTDECDCMMCEVISDCGCENSVSECVRCSSDESSPCKSNNQIEIFSDMQCHYLYKQMNLGNMDLAFIYISWVAVVVPSVVGGFAGLSLVFGIGCVIRDLVTGRPLRFERYPRLVPFITSYAGLVYTLLLITRPLFGSPSAKKEHGFTFFQVPHFSPRSAEESSFSIVMAFLGNGFALVGVPYLACMTFMILFGMLVVTPVLCFALLVLLILCKVVAKIAARIAEQDQQSKVASQGPKQELGTGQHDACNCLSATLWSISYGYVVII